MGQKGNKVRVSASDVSDLQKEACTPGRNLEVKLARSKALGSRLGSAFRDQFIRQGVRSGQPKSSPGLKGIQALIHGSQLEGSAIMCRTSNPPYAVHRSPALALPGRKNDPNAFGNLEACMHEIDPWPHSNPKRQRREWPLAHLLESAKFTP